MQYMAIQRAYAYRAELMRNPPPNVNPTMEQLYYE